MIFSLLFFISAFLVALVITPFVIKFSRGGIGLDHANESRKSQTIPIPRLGGIGIMIPLTLAMGVILWVHPAQLGQWLSLYLGMA